MALFVTKVALDGGAVSHEPVTRRVHSLGSIGVPIGYHVVLCVGPITGRGRRCRSCGGGGVVSGSLGQVDSRGVFVF